MNISKGRVEVNKINNATTSQCIVQVVLVVKMASWPERMPLMTPVADDFFQCPLLTIEEIQEYQAQGMDAMRNLLACTQLQGGPVDWTLHTNGPNVQIYTCKQDDIPMYLGTTQIESTLDEIRSIFTAPTTADVRELIAAYFPNLLDNVRLYTITDPLANVPHHAVTINWLLHRSPMRGVILKNRDWCYVEHQQDVIIDGKNAWLHAFKHVDVAGVPSLEAQYGIVRGKMLLTGFIYMETDRPGVLQVFEFHHNDLRGQLDMAMIGDFMVAKTAEIQCHSMNMMQTNLISQRLSRLDYLSEHSIVPKHARTKCAVCLRKFGTFSRKSNCRRCGEVVCSKTCSAMWPLIKGGIRIHARICIRCSNIPAEIQRPSKSLVQEDDIHGSHFTDDNFSGYTGKNSKTATPCSASSRSLILLGSAVSGMTLDGTLVGLVATEIDHRGRAHELQSRQIPLEPEASFSRYAHVEMRKMEMT
ncbi:hypothetical protein AeRB84_004480 [Aphanomyces euteiches]|nr:hypothetical protein AeRB84_004480 [Aphanomyces euteiches]